MPKKRLELPALPSLWAAGHRVPAIAARLGCSASTVRNRLKAAGLWVRRSPEHPLAAEMVRLYLAGESVPRIATRLNTTNPTVYRYLARAGLYEIGGRALRAAQTRATVTELYEEGYTLNQIVARSGIPRTTVYRHLNQAGDWFVLNPKPDPRRAYERILYLANKGYRQGEIAAQLGYTRRSVRRIRRRFGHPPDRAPVTDSEQQTFRRLWSAGHSLGAIARQTRRDPKTVRDHLTRHGVYERRAATWHPPATHPWRSGKKPFGKR